jgi:hypothetical protein
MFLGSRNSLKWLIRLLVDILIMKSKMAAVSKEKQQNFLIILTIAIIVVLNAMFLGSRNSSK